MCFFAVFCFSKTRSILEGNNLLLTELIRILKFDSHRPVRQKRLNRYPSPPPSPTVPFNLKQSGTNFIRIENLKLPVYFHKSSWEHFLLNQVCSFHVYLLSQRGSSPRERNLLLLKQVISSNSILSLRRASSSTEANKSQNAPLRKYDERTYFYILEH